MRGNSHLFAALLVSAALLGAVRPAQASVYGLSIGINDYAKLARLHGAVADAEDIAKALTEAGAEVTLLLNAKANRSTIEKEWKRIVGKAAAGDIFVFSYAGHGGQEPDKEPIDETDGSDEAFLLADFDRDTRDPGFKARVLDDEFFKWILEASAKGVRVIAVIDSCYSGGAYRSVGKPISTRYTPPYGEEAGPTIAALNEEAEKHPEKLQNTNAEPQNVSLLLAVDERKESPEVTIGGKPRGALSYAFARALQHGGDLNHDGQLSAAEIQTYVSAQVVQWSEGRQIPDFKPTKLSEAPAFKANPPAPSVFSTDGLNKSRLFVKGAPLTDVPAESEIVDSAEKASFIYSTSDKSVTNELGDVVAEHISAPALSEVLQKWRTIAAVKNAMAGRSIDVQLSDGSDVYRRDQILSIRTQELPAGRYVTVLNLAGDGSVTVLHPEHSVVTSPSKETPWPPGKAFVIPAVKVGPPFGADHVLLISSSKPLAPVFSQTNLNAAALRQLLQTVLPETDFEIGLVGIYSREKS